MGVEAIIAGAIIGSAGQIQAGRVAMAEAESADRVAAYNADIMEREAKAARAKGKFEQVRQAKHAARVKSTLQKDILAQGALGGGLLEEEQAAELELEGLLIGFEAETAAQRAESQAELDRLSGKMALQRGRAAKKASYIGAGATLLTGFGIAGMGGGTPTTTPTAKATYLRY
jgi:hypothetical protein